MQASLIPQIDLFTPASSQELERVRVIFLEYAQGLGVDLCFQDFETELATLPGEYSAPRGALLLATVDGQLAGCCALRPMDEADYPNAAEMKRLYVRQAFRGLGLGRQLAEAALDTARQGGYACVLLDKPNAYGSIFRFEGQASVFATKEGPCYRCLYPEPPPPGLVPSCAEGGVTHPG